MQTIAVLGAGKIGTLIATLLAQEAGYRIYLADIDINNPQIKRMEKLNDNIQLVQLDTASEQQTQAFIDKHKINALISSLPYFCNIAIAELAAKNNLCYFDLTEDVKTMQTVQQLAANTDTIFIPQCGLAPGLINIMAHDLMKKFDSLDTVKMRVGALPVHVSNALGYSLTWSTDGLINEYASTCQAIENGQEVSLKPLSNLENIDIDGLKYEAFNTSGGIGTLAQTYANKVKRMNYKSIRYPGHCEKMKFLMNDLRLKDDRETLKKILEHALPRTYHDVVLIYVSVSGQINDEFVEDNYVKKFYPQTIAKLEWAAIQVTTAATLCATVNIVLQNPASYRGFVKQEQFALNDILNNRFGKFLK